jgi:GABA permease
MRRKLEVEDPEALKIKMWLYPYSTYATIIFITGIYIAMFFIESLRSQAILTTIVAVLTVGSYFLFINNKNSKVESKENVS